MESENQFVDPAFCIVWPENRQFKSCIIYRYIIKHEFGYNSHIVAPLKFYKGIIGK